ncbi:hypothetical protein HPP92_026678 [Vanilla planifolia]|uniref:Uncharacterized protein n=1 Tax=Vanilla planifolia TaxID=51239 RepID=A0A835PEA0_VANPL|nr:hypothetical protein HPP92_026678 [Vanilla planifolia]
MDEEEFYEFEIGALEKSKKVPIRMERPLLRQKVGEKVATLVQSDRQEFKSSRVGFRSGHFEFPPIEDIP